MRCLLLLSLCSIATAFLNVHPSPKSCGSTRSLQRTSVGGTSLLAEASTVNGSAEISSTETKPKRKSRRSNNKKRQSKNKKGSKSNGKKGADRVIVSSKIVSNDKKNLLPLTKLKLGSTIEGHVASFTPFGIFIKTQYDFKNKGANGYALLHKSQMRDERVDDFSKLFRVGAKVKGLRVININYAKGEVGLSLRKKRDNRGKIQDIPVGAEMQGTVVSVQAYGAFVDVGAEANALVHISRISQRKIRNIRDVISEGEKVTIHILSKDVKKKTLAASMLDKDADEYLDKRSRQMKKMRENSDSELEGLKTEMEYFEEAVRELEDTLKDW